MSPQRWHYPNDIANDLQSVDLPLETKAEIFACAWEYSRCVIPHYTNWKRYIAFMRVIIIGIIAEFRGSLVDVMAGDDILGYSLDGTLTELFSNTPGHEAMAREYKTFLLVTSDKTSERSNSELFRRYTHALPFSPQTWFRLRDADSPARFTMASALACNDLDHVWYTEEQFEVMAELGIVLYDAVAFFKHRAEGETNNTFAYMPDDTRIEAFRTAREILWALDTAYARRPEHSTVMNFVRFFGGPIHMMMRRYRFVEENLTIGKPEDEKVIQQTKANFKLWNRVNVQETTPGYEQRFLDASERRQEFAFDGFFDILERGQTSSCTDHTTTNPTNEFGSERLCARCQEQWRAHLGTLPSRVEAAFPEVTMEPALPMGSRPPTIAVK